MVGKTRPAIEHLRSQEVATVSVTDPHHINVRLQFQISELLRQLEEQGDVDIKVRYMALMAIARMQAVFVALRKEKIDDPDRGSTVRKYAGAFAKQQANDARRRAPRTGPITAAEPEPSDAELDAILSDDGDDI